MKTARRRKRRVDPLATPAGVRAVCNELRQHFPKLIPSADKKLFSLLNAVRHAVRYSVKESNTGRPANWKREDLQEVAFFLQKILDRETQGRVSISSFVGLYLRILQFPADLITMLENGLLTLQEATILARLSHRTLEISAAKAAAIRRDIITAHIKTQGSQNSLRLRVKEALGENKIVSTTTMVGSVQTADNLLSVDPTDKYHLFYDQLKNLFFAMKEIKPEYLDDQFLKEFIDAADHLSTLIFSLQQKQKQKIKAPYFST